MTNMISPSETTIFISSNEPWTDVWFSKQHYANELAAMGFEVFFLNASPFWSVKHFFNRKIEVKAIHKNLNVVNYTNVYPLRFFKELFFRWNDHANSKRLKPLATRKNVIWWKFDPFRFVEAPAFTSNTLHIYHVTDPFTHIASDPLLAKNADLVVSVLENKIAYYEQYCKKPVLFIPHGLSEEEWNIEADILANYEKFRGCILMVGTINNDYSIDLLKAIAQKNPTQKIVIVGPDKLTITAKKQAFTELLQLPNVIFEGAQKARLLKYYIAVSALCIIPYDFGRIETKGTPLKALNYLAQNKATITSIPTGLEVYLNKAVYFADNANDFLALIERFFTNGLLVDAEVIKQELEKVKYPVLIRKILDKLAE